MIVVAVAALLQSASADVEAAFEAKNPFLSEEAYAEDGTYAAFVDAATTLPSESVACEATFDDPDDLDAAKLQIMGMLKRHDFEAAVGCYGVLADRLAEIGGDPAIIEAERAKGEPFQSIAGGRSIATPNDFTTEDCRFPEDRGDHLPNLPGKMFGHCIRLFVDTGATFSGFRIDFGDDDGDDGSMSTTHSGAKVRSRMTTLPELAVPGTDFGELAVSASPELTTALERLGADGMIGLSTLANTKVLWTDEGTVVRTMPRTDVPSVVRGNDRQIRLGYDWSALTVPVDGAPAHIACKLDTGATFSSFHPKIAELVAGAPVGVAEGRTQTIAIVGGVLTLEQYLPFELALDGVPYRAESALRAEPGMAPCLIGWDVLSRRTSLLSVGEHVLIVAGD